jgi:Bifunctional DNA primase/polymerase, N-terminal
MRPLDLLLRQPAVPAQEAVTITLADGTVLPGCRPDLLNIGDLMGRGWSIIPLKPRSKMPAVKWEPFQHRLATLEELEAWFTEPFYNVGIVTGTISKIFVVDCDSPEALQWTEEKFPPCDLRVRTARGVHKYYPYTGDRPMRNRVKVKFDGRQIDVDFRAEGGYVVGPGSVHENGHIYMRDGAGWRWS